MSRGTLRGWWLVVLAGLTGLYSLPASAQQGFEVLIDTNSRLIGCDVTTPGGVFEGAEYIVAVTTSADGSQITALSIRSCNLFNDTFGAPRSLPGPPLPIGQGLGTDGTSVLEFLVSAAELSNPSVVRLGLVSLDGGSSQDALLTRNGQPDGGAMLVVLIPPPPVPPAPIPTLNPWSLALLVVLLGVGLWLGGRLRRHPLLLSLLISGMLIGVVWAIELDGDPADWAGIDPLGTDPADDGIPDIRVLFGTRSNGDLVLRIDAVLNQPPQAQDDALTTDEDTVLNGDVLADNGNGEDSDPDNDSLTVIAVNGEAGDVGTEITLNSGALLTLNSDGSFVYDPNGAFDELQVGDPSDEDSFTYTLGDGRGGSDSATVAITITPVDDPPAPQDDDFTVAEGGTLDDNVRTNDNDPDNALADLAVTTAPISAPSHASAFTLNADGSFSYTHDGSETASDSFEYEICDPEPLCATATVTITVTPVNDPPVLDFPGAGPVNYDPFTDVPVILDPAATVTDVDSADFDGGVLTALIPQAANCNDADRIGVNDQGVGPDQISVSGTDVSFGDPAVLIGTITTEFDCTTADPLLAITLTADATLPAVQALLRNLNFSTTDDTGTDPRTVEVTVSDGDGGTSNTVSREVTLDEAPRLTSSSPANTATSVALGSNIALTFSELVAFSGAGTTVDCNGNVPFTVSGSPGTVITLDPDSDLPGGVQCTVTVAATDVTDTDIIDPPDNPVQGESFSFITVDLPPVVDTVVPADGAGPVAGDTNITLTFSEEVNVTGNWAQVACTSSGTRDVNAGLSVTDNNPTFILDPATDFDPGETCTVTVFAAQVSDTDGIPPDQMASDFTSTFTIDQAPGLTLVEAEVADVFNTVNGTFPGNGLINTDADTGLRLTFSEAVSITNDGVQVNCTVSGLQSTTAGTLSGNGTTTVTWTPGATFTPGETCTVTFDTTDVNDTDTVDPPDNLTATGSFQFEVRPAAVDDARTVTAHIQAEFTGASTLLANDTPSADTDLTIAFGETLPTVGDNAEGTNATFGDDARVQISSDGSLLYNPPPGAGGGATDTFFYRLTATHGSTDTAQVTVTINGPVVWFIDDDAAAGGNGTLLLPFNELVSAGSFNTVAVDESGDYIFLYDSIGNDAAFNCGLTLLDNQRLLGEGETQILGALTGLSPVPESTLSLPATTDVDPVLTASNTNCITLASGNTLRGFTVGNTGTGTGIAGSSVGTLVVRQTSIIGTGVGVNINGGILDASFDNISSSNNSGILLNNVSGDFDATTGTITAGSNTAVSIVGNPTVDLGVTLTSVSVNGANKGIVLTNTTGNSGGFTVTGTGSTDGSGGTIQNISQRGIEAIAASNISLSNMTLTNAATTDAAGNCDNVVNTDCHAAIHLDTVTGVTLTNVDIDGSVQQGLNGVAVNGLNLVSSSILNAGDDVNEGCLRVINLTGTSQITSSDLGFPSERVALIENTSAANLNLTVDDSTFRDTQSSGTGADGLELAFFGTSTATIDVVDSEFLRNRTNGLQVIAEDTSVVGIDITGSTFDRQAGIGIGMDQAGNDSADLAFNAIGNPLINGNGGPAVNVFTILDALIEGRINSNPDVQVGGAGTSGFGIRVQVNEDARSIVDIVNNTVSNIGFDAGIQTIARGKAGAACGTGCTAGRLDATIDNNDVTVDTGSLYDYWVQANDSNTTCANVVNNTASAAGIAAFRERTNAANSTVILEGFNTDAATTWSNNGNTPTAAGSVSASNNGTLVGGSCTTVSHPLP